MALTIPNEAAAAFADQAEPDSVHFDVIAAAFGRTGVVSGCAVTAQGTPDMTVAVAAGEVLVGTTSATVASGNVTITTADATHPRFDLIVSSNAGVKSAVAGTAAANAVFPAVPANSVALAVVYVPAGDTAIAANQIVDLRVILGDDVRIPGNLTLGNNKKLTLTADTVGGVSRLLTFKLTTQDDRPWLSWVDHNGVHKVTSGYHYRDSSSLDIHNAWEVKTTAADEVDLRTRISIPASADLVDIGLNFLSNVTLNRQTYVSGTNFGFRLKSNDSGGVNRIVAQFQAQLDASDNSFLFIDPRTDTMSLGAHVVFFRNTNTSSTSVPTLRLKKGNGSNTDAFVFYAKNAVLEIADTTAAPAATVSTTKAFASAGQLHIRNGGGLIVPVSEVYRLTADLTASTSNTVFSDLTGLAFPIAVGEQVEFEARIRHQSAATTTGIVLAVGGPAVTSLHVEAWTWTSATAIVRAAATAIDGVITMTGTIAANTDQWVDVRGTIVASAAGTVQLKFRSEVNASGVTPKRGSYCNVIARG